MLVISRSARQAFIIRTSDNKKDDIKVRILRIDPYKVSIGIEAPKDMAVLRDNIIEKNPGDSNYGND